MGNGCLILGLLEVFDKETLLSPYLFILCMEKLSLAIIEAVDQKIWLPNKVSKNGPYISYLFFADDVLLFTKAKTSQARMIDKMFDMFSKASGLKVSLAKSRAFYSKGVTRPKIEKLTSIHSIRCTFSLEKYLGFPIFKGRARKVDFDFIVEKMQSRLASWKHRFLNKAGRLALASSVLSSIPNYYMQIYWLPQSICAQIDKTTRDFIWKGNSNKGICLVGWEKITMPKRIGGLEI